MNLTYPSRFFSKRKASFITVGGQMIDGALAGNRCLSPYSDLEQLVGIFIVRSTWKCLSLVTVVWLDLWCLGLYGCPILCWPVVIRPKLKDHSKVGGLDKPCTEWARKHKRSRDVDRMVTQEVRKVSWYYQLLSPKIWHTPTTQKIRCSMKNKWFNKLKGNFFIKKLNH